DEQFLTRVYDLYFPRRMYFLSEAPETDLPLRLSDEGLTKQAQSVRSSLTSPVASLLKRVLPADPLGGFAAISDRLRSAQPPLAAKDGVFTTPDGRYAVLFL